MFLPHHSLIRIGGLGFLALSLLLSAVCVCMCVLFVLIKLLVAHLVVKRKWILALRACISYLTYIICLFFFLCRFFFLAAFLFHFLYFFNSFIFFFWFFFFVPFKQHAYWWDFFYFLFHHSLLLIKLCSCLKLIFIKINKIMMIILVLELFGRLFQVVMMVMNLVLCLI